MEAAETILLDGAASDHESIPAALAAPVKTRGRPKRAAPTPAAPASFQPMIAAAPAPTSDIPPAAAPADQPEDTDMATTIENAQTAAETTAHAATDPMSERAQAMFGDMSTRAKGAMEKSGKMVEEMSAFGKGNVEALVESSKIAAKGIETMGQDVADYTRKSFEDATATIKTLASVKSPTEFMKLQSDFMRASFDAMVTETSRSTEAMLKLAGEVVQPISNRVAMAAEKMKIGA